MNKDRNKPILITPDTNTPIPTVPLSRVDSDGVIAKQGYRVFIESSLPCPCKSRGAKNHLSTCKNCRGSGWAFVNKNKTKAIITSTSNSKSFKGWSEQTIGTSEITVSSKTRIKYMDRVTLLDSEASFSETLYPYKVNGEIYVRTTYPVKEIISCFEFVSEEKPLLLRENSSLTIVDGGSDKDCKKNLPFYISNIIRLDNSIFNLKFNSDFDSFSNENDSSSITLTYTHPPQYYIMDILRESMVSVQSDSSIQDMPIKAIGRMAHYILDAQNLYGDFIFDNSFLGVKEEDLYNIK